MRMFKIILLLLFSYQGLTQIKDSASLVQPKTEIGKVDLTVGTIIKKEFIDIYINEPKGLFSTGYLKAQVLNITDATTKITLSGLKLSNSYASSNSAFVDVDEIPGLLKFIEFLKTNETEKPENYTEYKYQFRDLQVYAYYSKDSKKSNAYWHYGINTNSYSSYGSSSLELQTLMELKDEILKKKEKFKQQLPEF